MGIEIERKYRVLNDLWRSQVTQSTVMVQGYLNDLRAVESGAMKSSVRVRIEGGSAHLNIKSGERGTTRQEFEYAVPLDDAQALIRLCVGGLIEKTRHIVPHGHLKWEIDEFTGANAGLTVAEIELGADDDVIDLPAWAGPEVTDEIRFYNLSLADYPFRDWPDAEKAL